MRLLRIDMVFLQSGKEKRIGKIDFSKIVFFLPFGVADARNNRFFLPFGAADARVLGV